MSRGRSTMRRGPASVPARLTLGAFRAGTEAGPLRVRVAADPLLGRGRERPRAASGKRVDLEDRVVLQPHRRQRPAHPARPCRSPIRSGRIAHGPSADQWPHHPQVTSRSAPRRRVVQATSPSGASSAASLVAPARAHRCARRCIGCAPARRAPSSRRWSSEWPLCPAGSVFA